LTTLGILHPGTMGAALAAAAVRGGARVVWASQGRSPATAARAVGAGAADVGSVAQLCAESDIVMSICPPAAAERVARDVAATGFAGIYVDANAISPERMAVIAGVLAGNGASVVDGAILGPPPSRPQTTRLYLAGDTAHRVGDLFSQGPALAIVLDEPVGSACALKMSYGSVNKATVALTALSMAMADRYGVGHLLATEWSRGDPEGIAQHRISVAGPKAWRWVAEMQEVADTARSAGLPDGFHRAAAEVFERWRDHRDPEGSRDAVVEDVDGLIRELVRAPGENGEPA
jgi:3-hydroxyisobutyrate dehydrogenase-like beta-hydroxyacid dehydrogenase